VPAAALPPQAASANACSRCGTDNDAARRLCRHCGNWLVVPAALPAVARTSLRAGRPWWLGGDRARYQGELSRTTLAYRVGAAVLALVVVVAVLTVTGQHPIRRTRDLVGHLLGSGRVTGVTASAAQGQGTPSGAVDDVRALGWSPPWPLADGGSAVAATACSAAAAAAGPALTLTLPGPTDVREIGIDAGLPAKDPQQPQRWRPKVLRLAWAGGGCQAVELKQAADLQRFGVRQQGPVTGVTVTILSAYSPGPRAPGPVDVGEITFWQR
jgi:hypothetical protein